MVVSNMELFHILIDRGISDVQIRGSLGILRI